MRVWVGHAIGFLCDLVVAMLMEMVLIIFSLLLCRFLLWLKVLNIADVSIFIEIIPYESRC